MKTRILGSTGISVSAIGLGCMGMDHAYGRPAARKDMIALLRRAVELGCTFFDTAVVYGTANEELLGEAFAPMRNKVVLATKFGIVGQRIENGKPVNLLDSRPASIRRQVEDSLRRLRTDRIDLYYQHRTDPYRGGNHERTHEGRQDTRLGAFQRFRGLHEARTCRLPSGRGGKPVFHDVAGAGARAV